jgi:hypothetical protein
MGNAFLAIAQLRWSGRTDGLTNFTPAKSLRSQSRRRNRSLQRLLRRAPELTHLCLPRMTQAVCSWGTIPLAAAQKWGRRFRYSIDFVMSRRFAPWRGVDSPPGQELLGVITSHGPYRESYRSAQKASGWATEAIRASAAAAVLPAESVRATLSAPPGGAALLQRGLPEGGAEVVALEGPATIPGDGCR